MYKIILRGSFFEGRVLEDDPLPSIFFIFAYFFSEFLSKSDEDIRSSIKVLNICQNGIFCIQQASCDIEIINYEWYIKD